jgi:hypothetical protein
MATFTALATAAICVVGAGVAVAAAAPTATTGAATNITSSSATLNASVSPNQNATTYYFQYGTTTGYASRTATDGPVKGNAVKSVHASVTGLASNTTYHFRVVAASSAGTSVGSDATFRTAAPGVPPPHSVTIAASPGRVTFGRMTTISGRVSGTANAGVRVTLEANAYPYTTGFKPTTLTATTTATGAYSLGVAPRVNTRYLVVAKTRPPVTSRQITVWVRVKVTLRVSTRKPARGTLVRFSGTITPAHNGKFALIQRRTSTGAWKTVASVRLVAGVPVNGIAVSKFARRLRISHNGTYRVRVNPKDGNHVAGTSATRTLRVH